MSEKAVNYIQSQGEFDSLCVALASEPAIALDTEFMRTDTFYAKIGLLQLANRDSVFLIDPLAIADWNSFNALICDSNCEVIIHSASEDLNLILTHCGVTPALLFDTQLAAAFAGLGFSLSYQALVAQVLNEAVEKGETRSNWLQRPLTPNQLHYAAVDVIYLLELADELRNQLIESDKLQWFQADCAAITETAKLSESSSHWKTLYTSVSNAWKLDDEVLANLRELMIWRELESRKRNRPRNWVVKDADLQTIASATINKSTLTKEGLASLQLEDRKLIGRYGNELLEVLSNTDKSIAEEDKKLISPPLDGLARQQLKSMKQVVELKAESMNLAPELLGRKKQLVQWLRSSDLVVSNGDKLTTDWRYELLSDDLAPILKTAGVSDGS